MKKIIVLATLLTGAIVFSCKKEEVNLNALDKFPPSIASVSPDGTTKVGNPFDVVVALADGPSSPLASATVTLTDSSGNVILTANKTFSNTLKDTVKLKSDDIHAATLQLGLYNVIIKAIDKGGNETDKTVSFKVSQNLYPSKNKAMYVAGVYNNWGADVMTLIAPFTWQIKNIDLGKGAFKFKNTPDWTDQDWGDSNCDGTVEISTNGGPNTDCGFSGLSIVTFYDNTLKYSVAPAVNYAHKIDNLYFLGTINNFEGTANAFSIVADNSWELSEVRLTPGNQYKFSVGPYGGDSYGSSGTAGKAVEFGPNFMVDNSTADAFYKITFNDKTLAYTLTLVRYPYPDKMYLVGGATAAGWNPPTAIPFLKTDNGKFELYANIKSGDGFKYLPTNVDYTGDWGPVGADANNASGALTEDGESNGGVASDGFYRITLDFTNKTFTVTKTAWSIIGAATPGGWGGDTDMTFVSGTKWAVDLVMTADAFKFRANHDWGINYGDGGSGKMAFNSSNNMSVGVAGTYHVEINFDPVNGYTYTATLLP